MTKIPERVWELGKFYRFKDGGERKHECVFITQDGSAILQAEEGPSLFRLKSSISLWEELKPIHKSYVVLHKDSKGVITSHIFSDKVKAEVFVAWWVLQSSQTSKK